MFSGLAPRRRRLLLVVAVLVAVGLVGLGVRVGVGLLDRPGVTPADQSRPGAVVLVPGYGGSQAALDQLAARLRAAGRVAVVLTLPGTGDGDLTVQADALDALVRDQLRGQPSVDVIGYSAGGVVVRLWVDRYPTAVAARRVVTLGSPLHGASIAAVGAAVVPGACPAACQQLQPGSALLRQLDAAPLPAGLPWLSVWTRTDETVTPPTSSNLDGAVNVAVQSVCADSTLQHGQLPTDPLVTGLILRDLGPAPLTTPPPPAECAALRSAGGS